MFDVIKRDIMNKSSFIRDTEEITNLSLLSSAASACLTISSWSPDELFYTLQRNTEQMKTHRLWFCQTFRRISYQKRHNKVCSSIQVVSRVHSLRNLFVGTNLIFPLNSFGFSLWVKQGGKKLFFLEFLSFFFKLRIVFQWREIF